MEDNYPKRPLTLILIVVAHSKNNEMKFVH